MTVEEAQGRGILLDKRVLVCCGAGGVGKTTVSAALALAAARVGRRVLVITIDPSRRLAETLGISRNLPHPVLLPDRTLAEAGVEAPGSLSAWVLDPQAVSDRAVRKIISDPEEAERLLNNRIYRNVTAMVAGMQEYTAIEALHGFILEDAYDLVVLDTPPSRNALRFLEAPGRAAAFLDKRIFNLFVPGEGSMIRRLASRLFEEVMDRGFGEETRQDLQVFFQLFSHLLGQLNRNQRVIQRFFRRDAVGFLLVTSPEREAVREALYFEKKTRDELELHLCGYVLNRSMAWAIDRPLPDPEDLPAEAPDVLRRAMRRLFVLARHEARLASRHAGLEEQLRERVENVWVLPALSRSPTELAALCSLGEALRRLMAVSVNESARVEGGPAGRSAELSESPSPVAV